MNCQTCTTPTKYVTGFWDSKDDHGQFFDCHNLNCELKRNKQKVTELLEEEKRTNIIENAKNGISMERVKMQRKSLGITIAKMANSLGVSCSDYSVYEQCREPLPVELRDRIEGVFEEQKGRLYGRDVKEVQEG